MNYIFKCANCEKPIATTTTNKGFFVALEDRDWETKGIYFC